MTRKRRFLPKMPRSDPQPPISRTRRILHIRSHIVAAFRVAIANKTLRLATALGLTVTAAVTYGIWFDWEWKAMIGWKALEGYINPDPEDTTGKKDAVQVYAVIVAGVIASITAAVGLANLRLTRKTLEQQRELEAQRAQGTALQAYYEQLGNLLTKYDLRTTERKEIKELARGQTLTVLQEVDGNGKGSLLTFLHGAGLIGTENLAVALTGADLQGAALRRADLRGANLQEADLREANLQAANLQDASFQGASLQGANLEAAYLQAANLQGARLQRAYLRGAYLRDARLQGAYLEAANLQEAWFPTSDLRGAYLQGADLRAADLEGANLQGADLRAADLRAADLQDADLQGANLPEAKVTDEQLAHASSLERATMPDGQKFEDWLKDKGYA